MISSCGTDKNKKLKMLLNWEPTARLKHNLMVKTYLHIYLYQMTLIPNT